MQWRSGLRCDRSVDDVAAWLTQVSTLSDFFEDETVFVAFGAEKYSAEQLTLSDEGPAASSTFYLALSRSVCQQSGSGWGNDELEQRVISHG